MANDDKSTAVRIGLCFVGLQQGPPLGSSFGDFVQEAGVTHLGVVPSIVATWRRSGCMAGVAWPQLSSFASTGEASSPEDYMWLMSLLAYRAPVLEYCGGVSKPNISCTLRCFAI